MSEATTREVVRPHAPAQAPKRRAAPWQWIGEMHRGAWIRAHAPMIVNGAAIRDHRERRGWTSTELAFAVGCSSRTILDTEHGYVTPSPMVTLLIAAVLEVSPASLFVNRTESAPPPLPPE